jgi:hypothetical protein
MAAPGVDHPYEEEEITLPEEELGAFSAAPYLLHPLWGQSQYTELGRSEL